MAQIDETSPDWLVINVLGKAFDAGPRYGLTLDELSINLEGVTEGALEVVVDALVDETIIDVSFNAEPTNYRLEVSTYNFWKRLREHDLNFKNEEWNSLKIDNFEEVATKLDDLASELDDSNEFKKGDLIKAEHIIRSFKSFAELLREHMGETRKKLVTDVTEKLKQLAIFLATTTGHMLAKQLVEELLQFLSSLF